jgi:glycosyltransferase involved in cell wall biosynthesis
MAGVLVHEWLGQTGGSEKVLDAFADLYHDADIYCLWDDTGRYSSDRLHESKLAGTPLRSKKALALPAMPLVWRNLNSEKAYDWALISSHLFAHHARFSGINRDIQKYVYVHTPARYIWEPDLDKRGNNPIFRAVSQAYQKLDFHRAQEHHSVVANSKFVADRILRCWEVEAQVVHPPVDVEIIQSVSDWTSLAEGEDADVFSKLPSEFVLGASRFVSYKGLEIVIRAAELVGLPVVIAGAGSGEQALRDRAAAASVPVTFVISPSDAMLYGLYQRCSVYVFPPVEDFGIMPVEAMAAGAPVVANRLGGTSESVVHGVSGYLADMGDESDVKRSVELAIGLNRGAIAISTSRFSAEAFRTKVADWVPSSTSLDRG